MRIPTPVAPDSRALHAAVLRGNLDLVEALLTHGADVDAQITQATGARRQSADYGFSTNTIGATPLYLAARYGEVAIMRALAAAGSDLRMVLPDGTTPMMAAMQLDRINSLDLANAGNGGLGRDRRDRHVYFRLSDTPSPEDIERGRRGDGRAGSRRGRRGRRSGRAWQHASAPCPRATG